MFDRDNALSSAAAFGTQYADSIGEVIKWAGEHRRQPIIDDATTRLHKSLEVAIVALHDAGATDRDVTEFVDAATYCFADRLVEILEA